MKLKVAVLSMVLTSCFLFSMEQPKYPKMDSDIKVYFFPFSMNGIVAGRNHGLSRFEENDNPSGSMSFMVEMRSDIASVGDFSFSWSMGCVGYSEDWAEHDSGARLNMGLSLGIGVYANHWSKSSLCGPCLYLYPVYQLPVYVRGGKPYWDWKCAADLGCTFRLGYFTIYPFCRGLVAWRDWKPKFGFDAGVSFGMYFPDPDYM